MDNINKVKRKKAMIGAAVGMVANIASSIIQGQKKKKAEEEQFRRQQAEANRQAGIQQAQALTAAYNDQSYVDDVKKKIVLKMGGKYKNNHVSRAKKFACGGRKKADFGSFMKESGNSLINSIGKGITAAITNPYGEVSKVPDNGQATNNLTMASGSVKVDKPKQPVAPAAAPALPSTQQMAAAGAKIQPLAPQPLKLQPTSLTTARYGTRKKAMLGAGQAIEGIGNLIGAIAHKPKLPKEIQKSDGFSYTSKQGVEGNSYQVDENGNPINATTVAPAMANDRIALARCGTKKKLKSK